MEHFMASVHDKTLRLDFSSSYLLIERAVGAMAAFLEQHACPLSPFDVSLVLREGLLNAIGHGNQEDPARQVHCTLALEDACLQIVVEDEGDGFLVPRQSPPEVEVESPQGRGLLLMYAYGFDVSFNAKGNRLVLKKTFAHA
jgi:anti-sigma regulatory factor (Ser/Thr protein kinase)